MITIKNYISMIYDDFREYIDQNVNLCMLKTLNYQAGQKPDYSDIHIQQLYLLRYVFSYAFEYKSMFDTLFAREKFKDSIEVASIGCGNMIDYWGLVEALGEIGSGECYIKYRGIWRYDPILISKRYTMDYHLKAFEEIASSLADYTEKVVISFVDLYAKTQRNTKELGIRQMTNDEMISLAAQMVQIASKYNLVIESCAEQINLHNVGVQHGSCIDKKLIEKILGCKLIGEKDKNQREECGCFESVEVGAYNTCLNGCKYCYANFNDEKVKENVRLYNQASPLLCGNITSDDKITDRKVKSLKDAQLSFFE